LTPALTFAPARSLNVAPYHDQDRDRLAEFWLKALTSALACPMEADMTRALGIGRICIIAC